MDDITDHTSRRPTERPVEPTTSRRRPWRSWVRSPAVAGVGVVVVLGAASAAAATDQLQIFQTQEVAGVTVSRADLVQLPDLSQYGDVEVEQEPAFREVRDAATAEESTGLSAPQVGRLPDGVTGDPQWLVGERVVAEFTFSVEEAARAAAAEGETLPEAPDGLDGNRFRLVAGPGLAALWSSESGVPALVVARAVAPSAYSSGVPFDVARDYLLELPGVPDQLAAELRSFSGDAATLPLVVPSESLESSPAEVGGLPATVLTSRDGALAGVLWVEDGIVTAVAGSLSADEVLAVARDVQSP